MLYNFLVQFVNFLCSAVNSLFYLFPLPPLTHLKLFERLLLGTGEQRIIIFIIITEACRNEVIIIGS
jgi:hypothetical protein